MVACPLGSTENLKSFVLVDVTKAARLEALGDALGVGVSVDDGFVIYDVERTSSSGCVTRGSPLGLTNVMAASVRVKTVWSIGSTITAVLASTLCVAELLGTTEARSKAPVKPFPDAIVEVDEVLT